MRIGDEQVHDKYILNEDIKALCEVYLEKELIKCNKKNGVIDEKIDNYINMLN